MGKPPVALEPHPPVVERNRPEQPVHQLPQLDVRDEGPHKSYWWVWLLIFAGIAFGCYRLYTFESAKKEGLATARSALKPRLIPIVAATAQL